MQKLAIPAALVVGCLLGYFGHFLTRPGSSNGSDARSVPESEIARLRAENASLRAGLDGAQPQRPSAVVRSGDGAAKRSPAVSISNAGSGDAPKIEFDLAGMHEQMRQQQSKRDAKQIAMQLAALKPRLKLDGEQEKQVRALMEARAGRARDRFNGMFKLAHQANGAEPEALTVAAAGSPFATEADTFDDDVMALLDDDQQAAYGSYLEDKRANELEAAASRDLASLQSMFPLTEEQKDRAFEAFTSLAADAAPAEPGGAVNFTSMQKQRESRMRALEPILTPEQMEVYRDSPQVQGGVMMSVTGDAPGASAVFHSITIDGTVGTAAEEIVIETE